VTFDFERLQRDLIRASKQALAEAKESHPREQICAFALYSDEGAMTVCPSIDFASARAARLTKTPAYPADMTFATAEWALESVGADPAFDKICKRLSDHLDAHPRGFVPFKRALFETCVDALATLRAKRVVPADCLLVFAVSDGDPSPRIDAARFARLNPGQPALLGTYRAWLRAFA
jgi:Domain of unknown function (DUF4303)